MTKQKWVDTLLCKDKEEAKRYIDNIGAQYIFDWEFLESGEVRLLLMEGWKND